MEIRANYFLVGLFTLLMLFGGLGFTLWSAKQDKTTQMANYDIFFTESVRGLSLNSDVLFSGIRVGKVVSMKISNVTPGAVRVRIAIAADTPVREDSLAQLAVLGLTGTAAIAVSGGTAESPLLIVPEGAVAEIPSVPSPLSSFMAQMPELIESSKHTLQRLDAMLSDDNIRAVSSILASLDSVTGAMAERKESIGSILSSTEQAAQHLDTLVVNANKALTTNVQTVTRSMNSIAKRVDGTLAVMEPGLKQFSTQGLTDMRMLMTELRNLVHVLTRVGQKLENDPRRFLFGEPVKEYHNR